jgi:hypothetical protein
MSAINQVARLAGTVGFIKKHLSRRDVFYGNSNIETHTLRVNVISHPGHGDGEAFMHKRIFH